MSTAVQAAFLGLVQGLTACLPVSRDEHGLTFGEALLIGCAQALALVPGVSRSGATLIVALLLGLRRIDAARFIFLLSIPAILGAAAKETPAILRAGLGGSGALFVI